MTPFSHRMRIAQLTLWLLMAAPALVGAQTAQVLSPAPGATDVSTFVTFQWTSVPDVQAYYLYVGTTPGANDVVNTGEVQQTTYTLSQPLNEGQAYYIRLYAETADQWLYVDSMFTTAVLHATLSAPADGASGVSVTPTFQWTGVQNVQAYYLYVGTTPGANDVINTGEVLQTTYTPSQSLVDNQTYYVRLFTEAGDRWRYADTTFTTAILRATLTNPPNAATGVTPAATFQWTAVPSVQAYYLYVGTTIGANDVINTGEITQTTYTPGQLLAEGMTYYVRLYTEAGDHWRYVDATFATAVLHATLMAPANLASGVSLTPTFQWTSVPNVQAYYLYVGSTPGANDIVNTGEILQTTYTPGQPLVDGQTYYARLYTKAADQWRYVDATFTTAILRANLTSPANAATGVSLTPTFQWTTVSNVQAYYLYVGTTRGANDVINTGEVLQTSYASPAGLVPGTTYYVRLYTEVGANWRSVDTTFTTAQIGASLLSPTQGSVVDEGQLVRWTSITGAQSYSLSIGTTPGGSDLVGVGGMSGTSYQPPVLPTGVTLYARLGTEVNGAWMFQDVSFSAAQLTARLLYPTNNAMGVGRVPLSWNSVPNAEAYYLYVGTTPGAQDIVSSGQIQATQYLPGGWPGGRTLFARLYTMVGGTWRNAPDVTFTTAILAPSFTYPGRGAVNVQLNQPFAWTAVSGSSGYRLVVSSDAAGTELLVDSGLIQSTTYTVTTLPSNSVLFARVYSFDGGSSAYGDTVFTLMPTVQGAVVSNPTDGQTGADVGQPITWNAVDIADGYRLELGTSPGANDLDDSGVIRVTRRLVPNIPIGITVYGRLSTKVGAVWLANDFTFTASSNNVSTSTRLQGALWATDFVRRMAGPDEMFIGTELTDTLLSEQLYTANCRDYSLELLAVLSEMNAGLDAGTLGIAFNPNQYDTHTLVEVLNPDTEQWVLLDPTFGLTVMRSADGTWATAEDVSAATKATDWGAVTFEFLGTYQDQYVRSYYLDYPLLYLNLSPVDNVGESVMPYLTEVTVPSDGAQPYLLVCSEPTIADVIVDGSDTQVDCTGVGNTSRIFYATTITATPTSPAFAIYRPRRFLF